MDSGYTLPECCPRGLDNCEPLNQIITEDGGFICCGVGDPDSRNEPGDIFRHCWKNDAVDEMSDWDRRDIITTIAVLSGALVVHENMVLDDGEPDETE